MRWFVESDFELVITGITAHHEAYNMGAELEREYNRRTSGHSQTDS